jgi:hypothetical protein
LAIAVQFREAIETVGEETIGYYDEQATATMKKETVIMKNEKSGSKEASTQATLPPS